MPRGRRGQGRGSGAKGKGKGSDPLNLDSTPGPSLGPCPCPCPCPRPAGPSLLACRRRCAPAPSSPLGNQAPGLHSSQVHGQRHTRRDESRASRRAKRAPAAGAVVVVELHGMACQCQCHGMRRPVEYYTVHPFIHSSIHPYIVYVSSVPLPPARSRLWPLFLFPFPPLPYTQHAHWPGRQCHAVTPRRHPAYQPTSLPASRLPHAFRIYPSISLPLLAYLCAMC